MRVLFENCLRVLRELQDVFVTVAICLLKFCRRVAMEPRKVYVTHLPFGTEKFTLSCSFRALDLTVKDIFWVRVHNELRGAFVEFHNQADADRALTYTGQRIPYFDHFVVISPATKRKPQAQSAGSVQPRAHVPEPQAPADFQAQAHVPEPQAPADLQPQAPQRTCSQRDEGRIHQAMVSIGQQMDDEENERRSGLPVSGSAHVPQTEAPRPTSMQPWRAQHVPDPEAPPLCRMTATTPQAHAQPGGGAVAHSAHQWNMTATTPQPPPWRMTEATQLPRGYPQPPRPCQAITQRPARPQALLAACQPGAPPFPPETVPPAQPQALPAASQMPASSCDRPFHASFTFDPVSHRCRYHFHKQPPMCPATGGKGNGEDFKGKGGFKGCPPQPTRAPATGGQAGGKDGRRGGSHLGRPGDFFPVDWDIHVNTNQRLDHCRPATGDASVKTQLFRAGTRPGDSWAGEGGAHENTNQLLGQRRPATGDARMEAQLFRAGTSPGDSWAGGGARTMTQTSSWSSVVQPQAARA